LASTQTLKKFSSVDELQKFLEESIVSRERLTSALQGSGYFYGGAGNIGVPPVGEKTTSGEGAPTSSVPSGQSPQTDQNAVVAPGGAPSYSTTNVQVANVDEPDFLKNDGKYVYILSGDKLTIVDAYPAENASIIMKVGIDIPQGQTLQNMFLRQDRLAIFYQEYSQDYVIPQYDYTPQPIYSPKTHIVVMDVSDKQDPKIIHDFKIAGIYNDARMVGNYAYLVTNSDLYDYRNPIVPYVMESSRLVAQPDIYYFDNPEQSYSFTTVTSVNMLSQATDNSTLVSKSFLMDPSSTIYASENNLYITYQKYMPYNYYQSNSKDRFFNAILPLFPQNIQNEVKDINNVDTLSPSQKWDKTSSLLEDYYNHLAESEKTQLFDRIAKALADYDAKIQRDTQKTVIHKIAIGNDGSINYLSKGEVPGRLLNQYSMDEDGNKFRLATTSDYYSQYRNYRYNNVYVLDQNLNTIGSLEQIAPDEQIYSARFMGDRLYLVTFKQVDPFFVIDLSTDQPKVLGKLKLPGFSNYLHPYDQTHIIGIGRETTENQFGGGIQEGVKVALFDVSDVENPVVIDTYTIGSVGTDSEVLYDHKALLFDKGKNILSLPITISDYGEPVPLPAEQGGGERQSESANVSSGAATGPSSAPDILPPREFPKFWRGFYVLGIDPQHGFTLKGTIEHFKSSDGNGFYPQYGIQGSRSFYIDSVLYTVSINGMMKMNSLEQIDHEINSIDLGTSGGIIVYEKPNLGEDNVGTANSTSQK
jgi:uncharacterized secreted protein with C-terminal beta-propeller domain